MVLKYRHRWEMDLLTKGCSTTTTGGDLDLHHVSLLLLNLVATVTKQLTNKII